MYLHDPAISNQFVLHVRMYVQIFSLYPSPPPPPPPPPPPLQFVLLMFMYTLTCLQPLCLFAVPALTVCIAK